MARRWSVLMLMAPWLFAQTFVRQTDQEKLDRRIEKLRIAELSNDPTEQELGEALWDLHTPQLDEALKSTETLWRFIVQPKSFYAERMAAAMRGGPMLRAPWLTRLI